MKNAAEFDAIIQKAREAGLAAYANYNEDIRFGGTCGSAVVTIPGRGNFAKYCLEKNLAMKVTRGLWVGVSDIVGGLATQNICIYEAVANAIAKSLTESGIKDVSTHSWVD